MKLTTAAVLALLEWKLAGAHPAIGLPPGGLPRPKPQPTGTGDPGPGPGPVAHDHDRGTFNMDCSKAGAACNNACWSIYCLQQDTRKQSSAAIMLTTANSPAVMHRTACAPTTHLSARSSPILKAA